MAARNLELRRRLLNDFPELVDIVRRFKRNCFISQLLKWDFSEEGKVKIELNDKEGDELSDALFRFRLRRDIEDPDEFIEDAFRFCSCESQRRKRLVERMKNMFEKGNCLFLTLTFTDSVLESTSADSRRQYVRRFLSAVSREYVGNIDYGGQNGREHYHAVVLADSVPLAEWRQYGNINVKRVYRGDKSARKLGRYVLKLVNHSLKCEDFHSLIYSRSYKEKFVSVPDDELPF